MIPEPPPGQGPIDPRGAFTPPGSGAPVPPVGFNPTLGPPPGGPVAGGPPQMIGGPGYPGAMRPMGPPPGVLPPPPFFQPPPPRRGRAGWIVASVLLLVLLLLSVLLNVILGVVSVSGGSDREHETTLVSGDEKDTIAVVPLEGEIDEKRAAVFSRIMDKLDEESDIRALVLRIDTPGGGVTASDEIYDRILRYKTKHGIPVVVSMGAMATSGGYYASCAADHLVAEPTTLTANIGVLMPSFNVSELMKKYGVEDATIVSTGATYKDAGSPFAPPSAKGTEYLQGIADSAFKRFKYVVKTGRGSTLKGDIEKIADGRVYVASEAASAGLIDEIGYLETAWQYAAKVQKLSKPNVVRYDDNPSLLEVIAGQVRSQTPPVHGRSTLQINGHDVAIDREALDRLLRPRLMYMWRGY